MIFILLEKKYLQYTLLLLIHYLHPNRLQYITDLQYTLLLLIQFKIYRRTFIQNNLQYTLLLLILEKGITNFILHPEFTIHFATINTNSYTCASNKHKLFTIHFATINTVILMPKS